MQYIILAILGIAFAIGVSAGLFAFISSIGIVQRMAAKTKTSNNMMLYENMIILGAISANIIYIFNIKVYIGHIGLCIVGIFFGIFVGVLAVSLAETIKTLPVFFSRIKLIKGLPYVVLAMAIGKILGSLFGLCYK